MPVLTRPWGAMHYRLDGPADGVQVVFCNSLGTDLRLWDAVLAHLPGVRAIRFDKPGHGLSDLCEAVMIDSMAADAAALIEAVAGEGTNGGAEQGRVVFVGLSIGGMIGQALAAARPDLVQALVLSNTAARMGTPEAWQARIAAVRQGGMSGIADGVMERWFGAPFLASDAVPPWRNMLARTDPDGYCAACAAIAQADLTATAAALDLPVLVIAGTEDGASPPGLVKATADLVAGARFQLIEGAGHLPCVETPDAFAALLRPFLGLASGRAGRSATQAPDSQDIQA